MLRNKSSMTLRLLWFLLLYFNQVSGLSVKFVMFQMYKVDWSLKHCSFHAIGVKGFLFDLVWFGFYSDLNVAILSRVCALNACRDFLFLKAVRANCSKKLQFSWLI